MCRLFKPLFVADLDLSGPTRAGATLTMTFSFDENLDAVSRSMLLLCAMAPHDESVVKAGDGREGRGEGARRDLGYADSCIIGLHRRRDFSRSVGPKR